jgi:hypothetical protein
LCQGAAHQGQTGQDQATEEATLSIKDIDGGGCAGDHHHASLGMQRAGADQGRPAVGAQLLRLVVAIADAAGNRGTAQPVERDAQPTGKRFDLRARRVTGDIAGNHASRRCRQALWQFVELGVIECAQRAPFRALA